MDSKAGGSKTFIRQIRRDIDRRLGRDLFGRMFMLGLTGKTIQRWESGAIPREKHRVRLRQLRKWLDWEQKALEGSLSKERRHSMVTQALCTVARIAKSLSSVGEIWAASLEAVRRIKDSVRHESVSTAEYRERLDRVREQIPSYWYKLRKLFTRGVWDTLVEFADEFPVHTLPSPAREAAFNWLMVAHLRVGKRPEAIEWFSKGMAVCKYPPIRADLLSNMSYLCALMGDFERARAHIADALSIDPSYRPSLYNKLVIEAIAETDKTSASSAKQLLEVYPEADDPDSSLGEDIMRDPDLAWFRTTPAFSANFPHLHEALREMRKRGIGREIAAVVLFLILSAFPIIGVTTESIAGTSGHAVAAEMDK